MTPGMSRPVLRYFGGKWILAPWIISHFPRHRTYVEPFGGGASVLLRKPRAYAEVYNDLDGEVVNLFRVLRDTEAAKELEKRLRLTPFARDEFKLAYRLTDEPIERARNMITLSFMGFGSDGCAGLNTGFRANANRSGTTPAHVLGTAKHEGFIWKRMQECGDCGSTGDPGWKWELWEDGHCSITGGGIPKTEHNSWCVPKVRMRWGGRGVGRVCLKKSRARYLSLERHGQLRLFPEDQG